MSVDNKGTDSTLNILKENLKDWILSQEPIDTTRIVPAALQEDFEEALASVLEQPTVIECHIEKGIYTISVEHAGLRSGIGKNPLDIIERLSLTIRRFYLKYGVAIHRKEIHIRMARNWLVIMIALNNYGRKRIFRLNAEQRKVLRRKTGR